MQVRERINSEPNEGHFYKYEYSEGISNFQLKSNLDVHAHSPPSTAANSCLSFRTKYKTEVSNLTNRTLIWRILFRCARTGSKQANASLEKVAHSHMETSNCKRRSMFPQSTRPSSASNTMRIFTVPTECAVNSCIQLDPLSRKVNKSLMFPTPRCSRKT